MASNDKPSVIPITPRAMLTAPSKRLSTGAYAGVGVGSGIVTVLLLATIVFAWRKKWWPFKRRRSFEVRRAHFDKAELDDGGIPRVEVMGEEKVELEAMEMELEMLDEARDRVEVDGSSAVYEMGGSR